jgi:O-antigen ligase
MRPIVGLDNFLELFALAIIIAKSKFNGLNIKNLKLITAILSISFILYFSRTMFALIVVVSLAFLGYLRISKKGLNYILIGSGGIILLYVYLFSIEIPRDSKRTIDNLLYKLKLAPSEIFVSSKNFDIENHAALWDHWRAYEANKAINQLNENGVEAWSFGLGAGSLIDLGFYAPLSSDPKGLRYISNIHNGYVFVLYKTGILGILLYIAFLTGNYLAYKKSKFTNPIIANMIFGIVLFYLTTSLVITGIYNLSDTTTLILGGILFLNHKEL